MEQARDNKRLIGKLVVVTIAMFVFGVFGMPPLYERFCEFTGIGQAGVRIEENAPAMTSMSDRTVRIRFDATTNSELPWLFEPVVGAVDVQVGIPSEASYRVENLRDQVVYGRAVYNVSPPEASLFFVKTECFCFVSQSMTAGEQREMPVRFYIDPDLPEDIEEVTLSYTFFLDQHAPEVAGTVQGRNIVN
jgi:cytochrome c oxidase assembly protein subunit 11